MRGVNKTKNALISMSRKAEMKRMKVINIYCRDFVLEKEKLIEQIETDIMIYFICGLVRSEFPLMGS